MGKGMDFTPGFPMSSLRPVVLESYESTLRGRRRSSHLALNAVPRLFSPIVTAPDSNDSAIYDEPDPIDASDTVYTPNTVESPSPPSLSPLSDAHVSDYFTCTSVDRQNGSPTLYTFIPSPTETIIGSGPPSRKASAASSETDVNDYSPDLERLKWRLASGFFSYFLCGWGDGVTGTVLPYFTAAFHLNPMTSSLLFAGSTCGFFTGTLLVEPVMNFLGRCPSNRSTSSLIPHIPWISAIFRPLGASNVRHSALQARHLVLIISSVIHAVHFVMIGTKRGYPATFMAYAVAAFSRALLTASLNQYFARGPQQALGFSYGLWSLGGVLSPIVCQTVISNGVPWPHFYFGSLVLSGINTALLFVTFKPTARENSAEWREVTIELSKMVSPPSSPINENGQQHAETPPTAVPRSSSELELISWAFSIFAMIYCGSETTTQGFMVTYLLGTRRANPKTVGYVTSGFWGGITIGRFAWGYFVPRLSFTQRKYTILTCLRLLNSTLHLLIWFINSNIQNAVSACVFGVLYGPLFPAILRLANDVLPLEVHMISMGVISAFASFGSALFPFIAGVISSIKGIHTIPYLTVPLGVVMIATWSLFPSRLPTRSTVD
ncbi:hypothetical protein D9615_005185 [Tricholomella constricta]|uniref:MFS general substrate transporter n=1 Tax=Tricholomella constricta TaxID=117010 RepID=A0A8H5M1S8_9AGAR|nr:hypothetical protein D9615_005185 [Tricholomella constricta]